MGIESVALVAFLVLVALSVGQINVAPLILELFRMVTTENLEKLTKVLNAAEKPIIAFAKLLGLIAVLAICAAHAVAEIYSALGTIWK